MCLLAQADDLNHVATDGGELKACSRNDPGLGKPLKKYETVLGYKGMGGPLYAAEVEQYQTRMLDTLRQDNDG